MRITKSSCKILAVVIMVASLSSCSLFTKQNQADPVKPTPLVSPQISHTPEVQLPELTAYVSQLTCENASPSIMWQGLQKPTPGATVKVAELQCGASESPEFGQVIETFSLQDGKWVSQGLASGPDASWRTIGSCSFAPNRYTCPAQTLTEAGTPIDMILVIDVGASATTWKLVGKA